MDEVEQKFLAAIAASPHDREARSVYADWLDERGDPRGEYLRLELQLHEIPARLAALAPHIADDWIAAIARTCDVVLLNAGAAKIQVIKRIREVTGLGLKDSKDIVDRATPDAPERIREQVPVDEARELAQQFAADGALVRILAHDGTQTVRPPTSWAVTSNPPSPDYGGYAVVITAVPRESKIMAIKAVREVTNLGLKEAKDLVERAPVTLFESTGRVRANDAANRLRAAGCTVEVRG